MSSRRNPALPKRWRRTPVAAPAAAAWHPLAALTAIQNWNPGVIGAAYDTVDLTVDSLGNPTGVPAAARSIVLCVVRHDGLWHASEAARPLDDVIEYYLSIVDGHGCSAVTPDPSAVQMPEYQAVFLPTDAQGRIGIYGNPLLVGANRWVYCLGWCDWTGVAAPGGTTVFGPGAMPLAWTDLDVSAQVGAIDALIWMRETWSAGGSDRLSVRYDGDAFSYALSGGWNRPGGVSTLGLTASAAWSRSACCPVAAGVLEHQAANAQNGQWDVVGYTPCTLADAEVFAAGAGPAVWTALDLTTGTGGPTGLTGEALCLVRFTHVAGLWFPLRAAARRPGDVVDYGVGGSQAYSAGVAEAFADVGESVLVVVSTDAAGSIEWIATTETWSVDLVAFVPA